MNPNASRTRSFHKLAIQLAAFAALLSAAPRANAEGDAAAGKAVYVQTCLMCHGPSGKGDGPAATALNPKPMNFNDATKMAKVTTEMRVKAVTQGGAAVGASPMMPPFGSALSPKQIQDVVAYIGKEFAPVTTAAK
ncbi:MAG: cytochrome c [Deltaproteobacteria bacterium]|nr:cytochrome c [Deltaproteobacteria bacterium]